MDESTTGGLDGSPSCKSIHTSPFQSTGDQIMSLYYKNINYYKENLSRLASGGPDEVLFFPADDEEDDVEMGIPTLPTPAYARGKDTNQGRHHRRSHLLLLTYQPPNPPADPANALPTPNPHHPHTIPRAGDDPDSYSEEEGNDLGEETYGIKPSEVPSPIDWDRARRKFADTCFDVLFNRHSPVYDDMVFFSRRSSGRIAEIDRYRLYTVQCRIFAKWLPTTEKFGMKDWTAAKAKTWITQCVRIGPATDPLGVIPTPSKKNRSGLATASSQKIQCIRSCGRELTSMAQYLR